MAGKDGPGSLHSRPTYYGILTALWCGVPALILFSFWLIFEPTIISNVVISGLPEEIQNLPDDRLHLVINDIKNLVSGNIVSGEIAPWIQSGAEHFKNLQAVSKAALAVVVLSLAIGCALLAWSKISPAMRARNHVELFFKYFLIKN